VNEKNLVSKYLRLKKEGYKEHKNKSDDKSSPFVINEQRN